jgi:hypothetical protein
LSRPSTVLSLFLGAILLGIGVKRYFEVLIAQKALLTIALLALVLFTMRYCAYQSCYLALIANAVLYRLCCPTP